MQPDWSRETPRRCWDPSRRLLRAIRGYQRARPGGLRRRYWALQHRFWSVVTGAEIHLTCEIGGGLLLPHPNGIVIHPDARIGANCLIMHQVTLGTNGPGPPPTLGDHVDIGPGAKLLGAIRIGDDVVIGANAVVTRDVPPAVTVGGIPARELNRGALHANPHGGEVE